MRFKFLILLMVSINLNAQSSHKSLCTELISDMRQSIADSTGFPAEQQTILFEGEGQISDYLNEIVSRTFTTDLEIQTDTVKVMLDEMGLSIDETTPNSSRNTEYRRKLNLKVSYGAAEKIMNWQGSISDIVSKDQMKALMNEPVPITVTGDYLDRQPGSLAILFTTLTVLSLVASLYFIRT